MLFRSHFGMYSPPQSMGESLDPFINFNEFHMDRPTFPPHPHAGFSVLTYLFEDSPSAIINRDSLGDHSRIAPGGLHWTQAGRGVQHEENPERPYKNTHGFQLWVNHSGDNRLIEPKAVHADPNEIPEAFPTSGARVRILASQAFDQHATFTPMTPITLLEVHLEPHISLHLNAPHDQTAFLTIIRGAGSAGDQTLETHALATFEPDGDSIHLNAGADGLNALFGAGKPLLEETVFGGPFVMSNPQQLLEAQLRFRRGEMGALESSA